MKMSLSEATVSTARKATPSDRIRNILSFFKYPLIHEIYASRQSNSSFNAHLI